MPRRHSGKTAKGKFNVTKGIVRRGGNTGTYKTWLERDGVYTDEEYPPLPERPARIVHDVEVEEERI